MMKQKTRQAIAILLMIALIIGGVAALGMILRPTDTDIVVNAIENFHSMQEDSVEVLCCGSSRLWRGIDPVQMYQDYGVAAYNYGSNWQRINTTELFINDALRTQSPKVVVIETSKINSVLEDTDVNGELFYTRSIDDSPAKRRYLKQALGNDLTHWFSYYVPLYMDHGNWVSFDPERMIRDRDNPDYRKTMGFYSVDGILPVQLSDPSTTEQKQLKTSSVSVLDRIVDLCRENDIALLFYTSPCAKKVTYVDALEQYAGDHGVDYLNLFDYLDEIGIDGNTDFADTKHLNCSGAAKVTDFLGKYIAEHYDVTDMRTVEGNPWQKVLESA